VLLTSVDLQLFVSRAYFFSFTAKSFSLRSFLPALCLTFLPHGARVHPSFSQEATTRCVTARRVTSRKLSLRTLSASTRHHGQSLFQV
jgi:hypothetical protein